MRFFYKQLKKKNQENGMKFRKEFFINLALSFLNHQNIVDKDGLTIWTKQRIKVLGH